MEKARRFVSTELEPYIAVAFCSATALSLTLVFSGGDRAIGRTLVPDFVLLKRIYKKVFYYLKRDGVLDNSLRRASFMLKALLLRLFVSCW